MVAGIMGLLVACVSRPASQPVPIYPEGVNWPDQLLLRHREPPLWPVQALDGYLSRLRMSIEGINRLKVIVRIDQSRSGQGRGTYVEYWTSDRGTKLRQERNFRVSPSEMKALFALASSQSILTQPRQSWTLSEDTICLDGEEVLIELADADGYRAAGANAQCTAPRGFTMVAEQILDLAGANDAKRLLH